MAHPQIADGGDSLRIEWGSAANILNKKSRITYKQRSSSLEIERVLTLLTVKTNDRFQGPREGSYKYGNNNLDP
jgi:hypothetical protein